jgi:UDP-N-acetylmuramyl pentapeptide phosphotransferase/UDP-N-acetylglucosamine-1-phosphate transferase
LTGLRVIGVVIASTALCAALIVLLRPLLIRHALAHPNARSSHKVPTPQGGGIAVIGAALCVALAAAAAIAPESLLSDLGPLVGATVLLAGLGAVDDVRPLPVLLRLVIQLIAVATVAATLPGPPMLGWIPGWTLRAILVLAGMWFVNLVNFMDGIDLMTVAEVVPVSAAMLVLGGLGVLPRHGILVAAALLGSMIGFSPFNRPVARLFLGDVGSLPLGLLMGWLLAQLAIAGHVAAALLLPAYYLADSTLTLLIRLATGERIWAAHRSHFYQRALDRGFSVARIVACVAALNLVLAALAIATATWPSRGMTIAGLTAGIVLVALLLISFARGKP